MKLIITFVLFLFLTLISPILSYANDREIVGSGGTLKVLSGENKYISMESEDIFMDIKEKTYKVTVNFIFKNNSTKNVTVKMGFPESGHGGIDVNNVLKKTAFTSFKSYINGKLVQTKRKDVSIPNSEDVYSYETHWIKDVSFKPNEILKVKVEYNSIMGQSVIGPFAEYNFTGKNWKGKVKKSTLTAKFYLPKKYEFFSEDDNSKNVKVKNNTLYFEKTNWEADYYLPLMFKDINIKI